MNPTVLIVDDDPGVTTSLALLLKQSGYNTRSAESPEIAVQTLEAEKIDLVLQDMNFSRGTTGEEGLNLLKKIKEIHPFLPVILITAWGSVPLAVKGIRAGAADFITKPWTHEQILHAVKNSLEIARVKSSTPATLAKRLDLEKEYDFSGLIGEHPDFVKVLDIVGRVSATEAPVLITGESGTGKELIAEAICKNSERKNQPFVKVNLGGIPSQLFESEMFGHVRGAFTDAKQERIGRFEAADKGTLFLDEIGDLELSSQVKLLRVLQDRTFEKVGSSKPRTVNVRIISATNRNLPALIDENQFREDLFYRLNLITIQLPPLRERRSDIPLLAQYFLDSISERYGHESLSMDSDAVAWLKRHPWPGNIRQMRQTIERTVLLSTNAAISRHDLEQAVEMQLEDKSRRSFPEPGTVTLMEMERKMVLDALERFSGHITNAAEALGISRSALYRKMEKHGISL